MSRPVLLAVEQLRRPVPGGVGRYAACLIEGLSAAGAPIAGLLASRAGSAGPDPLARFGFPVHASALPGPLLIRAWDAGLLRAPSSAPVVHAVSLAAPPVRRAGPAGRRQALTVTVHDLAWRAEPASTTARGRRWHEAALQRALARADHFVVPSAPVAAALERGGAAASRVTVIGHGVDHLAPPDDAAASALLARLGVRGPYVLAAGTREPRKNLARLVAAYRQSRPQLEELPLVVVGPAGWGDAGVDPAAGVVVAGAVPDGVLTSLYRGAWTFCYVPLAEGFGLPPVEAMACGVPVVASTAVPSVAPAGEEEEPPARCVDPRSVDEIATALVAVCADTRLRERLRTQGAAHVAGWTWRAAAEAHLRMWEHLG